ncbi:MAG: Uma2 family endonuclease [Gemmataceae bacterium]|nr:Uma2 family endonuclease [Gemmataceae bacterium]
MGQSPDTRCIVVYNHNSCGKRELHGLAGITRANDSQVAILAGPPLFRGGVPPATCGWHSQVGRPVRITQRLNRTQDIDQSSAQPSGRLLNRWFARILSDDWVLQVQGAITLAKSEPEPDIAIVAGPEDRYDGLNPGGHDSHLIVEVADTSLFEDRGVKLQIYAEAKIPIYWIVNLIDRPIEEYTQPRGGKKATCRFRRERVYSCCFGWDASGTPSR